MSSHGVLIPVAVAALNVDSWNRSCVSASAIDNGNVLLLSTKSATAGQAEAWTASAPVTSYLQNLWMAYEPEIVTTISGTSYYKGLDPDPRNFYNAIGSVFSAFLVQMGDIVTLTADALDGAYNPGVTTHVIATNAAGIKLSWNAGIGTGQLSLKLQKVTYISVATGGVDTQRVTAYQFEAVLV
jgi:hypothetical protein